MFTGMVDTDSHQIFAEEDEEFKEDTRKRSKSLEDRHKSSKAPDVWDFLFWFTLFQRLLTQHIFQLLWFRWLIARYKDSLVNWS